MGNLKRLALLLFAVLTMYAVAPEVSAQQRRTTKTTKASGTTQKARKTTQKSTPSNPAGTIATFTAGENTIYLIQDGTVKSNNANLRGNWEEEDEETSPWTNITTVTVADSRYDGEIKYLIDKDTAYKIYEGSVGAELYVYDPERFSVTLEIENDCESIELSEVESFAVKYPNPKYVTASKFQKGATANLLSGLAKALADVTLDKTTSVATLDKQLAWAENIRTEYVEPLAAVLKIAGKQAAFSGQMEPILYEKNKHTAISENLSTYVIGQDQYTMSGAGMIEGMFINLNFCECLTLQHINRLLGMMPAESTESFKEAMVALYASESAFEKLFNTHDEINGKKYDDTMAKLNVIANNCDIVSGTNIMLFNIWKVLEGKGIIQSVAADDALEALCGMFTNSEEDFMKPHIHVTFDEYEQLKSRFATDGKNFIAAYDKWAAMIPGKASSLSDVCAIVFKQWTSPDEEPYNTNI